MRNYKITTKKNQITDQYVTLYSLVKKNENLLF